MIGITSSIIYLAKYKYHDEDTGSCYKLSSNFLDLSVKLKCVHDEYS